MRSAEILFVLCVVGLASIQVFGDEDEKYQLRILGKEIKRLMSHPNMERSCLGMPANSTIAYVNLFNTDRPYKLVCTGRKTDKALSLMLLEGKNPIIYDFLLDGLHVLSRKTNDKLSAVDNEEVFKYVRYTDARENSPFVHEDKVPEVTLREFDKETMDALFRNAAKIFVPDACILNQNQNSVRDIHFESYYDSFRMSLDCKARAIELGDELDDIVWLFVGPDEILLNYNWETGKYSHEEVKDSERWVTITYFNTPPSLTQLPLYSNDPEADITIPLLELKNDLADLWYHLHSSNNKKGAVVLGDKMILNLTKNFGEVPGQKTDFMQVGGIFEAEGSQKIFFKDDFCDQNGVKITPESKIQTFSDLQLSDDTSVQDYVHMKPLARLFSYHYREIDFLTKDASGLNVDFVYKDRSVFRTEHTLGDIGVYRIENLRTLTTHRQHDGKLYAATDVHTSGYYVPNYDHGSGCFITPDTPVQRNIFAVRLERYQPPEKGTSLDQRLEYLKEYPDWKVFVRKVKVIRPVT